MTSQANLCGLHSYQSPRPPSLDQMRSQQIAAILEKSPGFLNQHEMSDEDRKEESRKLKVIKSTQHSSLTSSLSANRGNDTFGLRLAFIRKYQSVAGKRFKQRRQPWVQPGPLSCSFQGKSKLLGFQIYSALSLLRWLSICSLDTSVSAFVSSPSCVPS